MKLVTLALLALLAGAATGSDVIKGNSYGSPHAPLLIEVFSDFECPACKTFHDTEIPQLMKDYVLSGKAYLVYRYFPLAMHQHGREAAEWVCAAAQIGKYQQAADTLFAHQQQWAADGRVEQTVNGVLTPAEQQKVKGLLKSPAVQDEINRDMAEGAKVPITGTPELVVTYRLKRYPVSGVGVLNYSLVKSLLDDLLKQ